VILAQGASGALRVGYRDAARLGLWRLESVEDTMPVRFRLSAAIASLDPFWSAQRPLTARLVVSSTETLIFDNLDPAVANGAMTATTCEPPATRRSVA
jgi:hypothetical protein